MMRLLTFFALCILVVVGVGALPDDTINKLKGKIADINKEAKPARFEPPTVTVYERFCPALGQVIPVTKYDDILWGPDVLSNCQFRSRVELAPWYAGHLTPADLGWRNTYNRAVPAPGRSGAATRD